MVDWALTDSLTPLPDLFSSVNRRVQFKVNPAFTGELMTLVSLSNALRGRLGSKYQASLVGKGPVIYTVTTILKF